MQDFTTVNPLIYNISQSVLLKLQKPLTLQQAKNLPEVKQALDRWQAKAVDQSIFGIKDEEAQKKSAVDFLADPTKVGLADFGMNFLWWVLIPESLFHGIEWAYKKIPDKLPKIITNAMKEYGTPIGLFLLCEAIITPLIQIPFSVSTANKQKETNTIALQAIQQKGINAKYGDADTK